MSRTVAIVGRPNVGKSRLFNRLAGRRISIVHDQPGVTRDIVSAEVKDGGYLLLDTGGLGLQDATTPRQLIKAAEEQVHFAIASSPVIVFVVDAREGLTALDTRVAALLRKGKKSIILAVNKADSGQEKVPNVEEFFRLGFGEPIFLSAEHGNGEADLRIAILEKLALEPDLAAKNSDRLTLCFVGRPNVGKSSLSNRLLKSDRLIVSDIPGTTRDSVEIDFEFKSKEGKKWPFRLIDTAGIRASTKLSSSVEYFSRVRSLDAIRSADVVYMVLDAMDGVTQQDKAIAGEIVEAARPIVVVVNKWDLVFAAIRRGELKKYKSERDFRVKFEKALHERLFFTPGAPVMFVSALTGNDIERMLKSARALSERLERKIPTAKLNQTIIALADRMPAPSIGGQRFRVYYATQVGHRPFRIKLFCNREEKLTEQYRRYLEAGVVKEFDLDGCPIHFDLVGKKKQPIEVRLAGKRMSHPKPGEAKADEVDEFDYRRLIPAMLRTVFMGSDAIALPLLNWLADEGRGIVTLVAVYTQPDRAVGRGQKVQPNAIKLWAQARGLPVHQPEKLTPEELVGLKTYQSDVALIMAYGHILRQDFIDAPRLGTLNLHTSLLPKYRGASPIQSAIANGERETGVTLMRIVSELDAGPIADVARVNIAVLDTALEVEAKLAQACVPLLARALPKLADDTLAFMAQNDEHATFCRKLEKSDGALDFAMPASLLAARINGLFPWPACSVEIAGQPVKLGLADTIETETCRLLGDMSAAPATPGTVLGRDAEGLLVATGQGVLRLRRLQRPGAKLLNAADFLRGFPVPAGTGLVSRLMPALVGGLPFSRFRN